MNDFASKYRDLELASGSYAKESYRDQVLEEWGTFGQEGADWLTWRLYWEGRVEMYDLIVEILGKIGSDALLGIVHLLEREKLSEGALETALRVLRRIKVPKEWVVAARKISAILKRLVEHDSVDIRQCVYYATCSLPGSLSEPVLKKAEGLEEDFESQNVVTILLNDGEITIPI